MSSARPSFPVPSEPSLRRLGVGGRGGGGGDKPLRAQLVVAICALLVVVAIPLYFLRRPSQQAGAGSATPSATAMPSNLPVFGVDAGRDERVRLGPVQRVKCAASATAKGQEGGLCDRLPFFEEGLLKAIKDNVDCAPKSDKEGSINFALSVDFNQRKLSVFPGQSGDWRGPQAKRTAQCVSRSMPQVEWEKVPHQYRYYLIAVLATYPVAPPDTSNPLSFD